MQLLKLEPGTSERQLADPRPGRSKNCVGNSRRDWRKWWLAKTCRRNVILNEMTLDVGGLVDAQHRVSIEIDLLRCSAGNRGLELRRADPVDHTAFHLVSCTAKVQNWTDIDG